MGWLDHKGKCVYCGVELADAEHMIGGLATTDHLLPAARYEELDFTRGPEREDRYLNAVPACA
ncbi:MAG TPA: hypothetical protein VK419_00005, partial [Bryobacteraceae bacterium]|nr:hypothetical protein [Bryobacteraceae bacterium]